MLIQILSQLLTNAPSPPSSEPASPNESGNGNGGGGGGGGSSNQEYRFSQCVSQIRVLSLRLRQSERRCRELREELEQKREKQQLLLQQPQVRFKWIFFFLVHGSLSSSWRKSSHQR